MHLGCADHLPTSVPLDEARGAVGGIVAKALRFPNDCARELIKSCHADVLATGGDNDFVAIDERMLADALVVGRESVFLPVIDHPQLCAVGTVQANEFAHIADHVEAGVIDDGCGTSLLERLGPCMTVGHLPLLCAVERVASKLLFLLIVGQASGIDESVADQRTGISLPCIVHHPELLGTSVGPLLQEVFLVGVDATMVVASEIDVLGMGTHGAKC